MKAPFRITLSTFALMLVASSAARSGAEFGYSATATCNCTSLIIEDQVCHSEKVTTSVEAGATISVGDLAASIKGRISAETGKSGCTTVPIASGKCVYYKYTFACQNKKTWSYVLLKWKVKKVCTLVTASVVERDPAPWEC